MDKNLLNSKIYESCVNCLYQIFSGDSYGSPGAVLGILEFIKGPKILWIIVVMFLPNRLFSRWQQRNGQIIYDVTSVKYNKVNEIFVH